MIIVKDVRTTNNIHINWHRLSKGITKKLKVSINEKSKFGGGRDGGMISATRAKELSMGIFFSWADLAHSEGGLSLLGWLLGG